MAKRKNADKINGNGANLGFEAKLWLAADKLRGHMDASEYKHVVLGLIFLKYISDAFQEHYEALKCDPEANPEDRDEYTAKNVFWVPKKARWSGPAGLQANAKQPTIGKLIDDAMVAIEKENPVLKGVLPKDYARPSLDKTRLGELIDLVSTIGLGDEASRSKDILGRVYEYFLGQFASAEGKGGGEFYTPQSVVKLLVEMIEPYKGRIFDPCCGSGGMFVQSEKFVLANGSMSSNTSGEGDIRQAMVEADLVDCMIAMPGQLFYTTQIPVCLWFVARNKKNGKFRDRRGQTLFIDARKLGSLIDRTHRELSEEEIARIGKTYHAWRGEKGAGKYADVAGFCKSATTEEITGHGFVLTPGRYVGAEEIEDDGEPFEQKMQRLTTTLFEQFAESARLEKAIRKNLKGLGYGG